MPMYSEALSLAAAVVDSHPAIRQRLARLWDRLVRGHARVVILGSGGVGKTTLGRLLGHVAHVDPSYRESTEIETYHLPGGTSCSILVPPGQKRLRDATWTGLEAYISRRRTVVIHVVAYGLQEIQPLPYTALPTYREGMSPREAMEAFAAQQRETDELQVLDRLARVPQPESMRLVTVVTKQDLWWRWRNEVREHYEHGPYSDRIDVLRGHIGTRRFHHTVWSVSLIMKNLVDGEGTTLLTTSEGYDEPRRLGHEQRLIEILEDAARNA